MKLPDRIWDLWEQKLNSGVQLDSEEIELSDEEHIQIYRRLVSFYPAKAIELYQSGMILGMKYKPRINVVLDAAIAKR